MKSEPLRAETADVVALALASVSAALFVGGQRALAALAGLGALTLLALHSWLRARRLHGRLTRLESQRAQWQSRADRLEPKAAAGLASVGLAHELKNDLMVAHGFAQLAKKAANGHPGSGGSEHLEIVVAQLEKLIDRSRQFARLADLDSAPTHRRLSEVVEEVGRLVAPLARQRGIAFESDLNDAGSLRQEVADPGFRAALLDLLLNAVEHAKTKVSFVLGAYDPATLSVEDDGPGVSAKVSGTLFEPFVTSRLGGTGIGLHRAKAAIEQEGGTLAWDDAFSNGARFIVTLPASVVKSGA